MPDRTLLRCHNLSHAYQEARHTTPVLHEITLQLQPAALVALVGSSGSGKSTLLHLLGGLLQPTSGEIFFQEQPLHQLSATAKARLRNHSLGFIYQFHHLLPDFTAWENVALPLLIAGEGRVAARSRALALLAQVGLQQRCDHRPATLSGGERQRVAIARALVNRPALVLADEPTGALDRHNAQELLALMLQFNASLGTAFLVATHDLTLAGALQQQWQLCDGVLQAPATG